MSKLEVDAIEPQSGTTLTLGASGDAVNIASGASLTSANPMVFPAGTASLPAITTTGDLNTGIYFPAADTIGFAEGGAEAMRINSSGNVGIGTSSPSAELEVNGSIIGNLELAPGKEYSMTSGAGTGTAIFDTNISLGEFGILEVFYRGNSNAAGTASYQQTGLYYIQIGTGFNGSAVATAITQTEVFKHVPFGSPGALTFSSVIFDGSSEVSSVTSIAGCQIRIKIAGYNSSYTGSRTEVVIRRIF